MIQNPFKTNSRGAGRVAWPQKIWLAATSLLVGASLLVPLFGPAIAHAAGPETYTWTSHNSLNVSGGDLSAGGALTAHPNSDVSDGAEAFRGTVIHSSGCRALLEVVVGGTAGNVAETVEDPTTPTDPDTTCGTAAQNDLVGQITISNSRPAQTTGTVTIRIWARTAFPEAPANLEIRVVRNNPGNGTNMGTTVAGSGQLKQADAAGATNIPPDLQAAFYEATFPNLTAGEYTVCTTEANRSVLDCLYTKTGDYSSASCSTKNANCYNFAMVAGQTTNQTFNNRPVLIDPNTLCNGQGQNLGWLVCGAIALLSDGAQRIDEFVIELLTIKTDPIFNPNNAQEHRTSSEAFYKSWGIARNIAFAILIIIGLFMVISQVLGIEVLDAYTLRKMIFPIAAAVIVIPLSWFLLRIAFTAGNDAAFAAMDIIREPFRDIDESISIMGGRLSLGNLVLALTVAAGVAAVPYLVLLGAGGVLALVASAFLAIISAFVLLAARNTVAYLLIVVAPIAIICGAFEPFKKLFTLWKTLLITILLSVPAVAAVLSIAKVGALIAYTTTSASNDVIGILTAIAIYVGGYFLVWSIFKKLDAVAGQLGNVVSAATGKLQKGLAEYRENTMKNRVRLWKQGALFSENGFMGRRFNDVGRRIGAAEAINATKGGGGLTGAFIGRDRRALLSTYDNVVRDQRENDPMLKAFANNDDANAVLAGSGGVNTDEALAQSAAMAGLTGDRARAAISGARALGVNRANAMTALRTALKNKGRGISAGNVRFVDHAVRSLSSNESEFMSLAHDAAFFARSNGRADLGGTEWISYQTEGDDANNTWQHAREVVAAEQDRRTTMGEPAMDQQEQQTLLWQTVSDSNTLNGIERLGVQAMVAGHDNQVVQAMDTLSRVLTLPSSSPRDRLQAAIALKEIQGNMPAGASGGVRDAVNRVLYNAPNDPVRPGLGLNASGNIAQQLAERAGLDGRDGATAGQTLTTLGRTYGEYTGAEEARRRAAGRD